MEFVWNPNKGEGRVEYFHRASRENPNLSLKQFLHAANRMPPRIVIPKPVEPVVAKVEKPRNDARELELEKENAKLRLQVLRLEDRLSNAQALIRGYHKEMTNGKS